MGYSLNEFTPTYELIGEVVVGSNTTQVDFTGLNIGKDDELMLVSEYKRGGSDYGTVLLACDQNGTLKTSMTDYWFQECSASSTTITGYRANVNCFSFGAAVGNITLGIAKLKLTNSGNFIWQHSMIRETGGSSTMLYDVYGTSIFTTNSITKLSFYFQSTGGSISAGSRFQLYKLVAEKVADIIVPSNTTSVDITGLNIGKDGEYRLVSDVYNPQGTTSAVRLLANSTTSTDYYEQYITANGTSVSSARTNASILSTVDNGTRSLALTNIKLTNSGYFVFQANNARMYGGSGIIINNFYNTSTTTMTSATSLQIQASVTNAIGANSRFTLYKMR